MNIRETGSIDLLNVVVHVIDKQTSTSADKSSAEIHVHSMDHKVKAFIMEHIRASVKNNESKLARYEQPNTQVQTLINEMIQSTQRFLHNSQRIADILFSVTPLTATAGCIIVTKYTNTTEEFVAIIKLDKNDAFSYEINAHGSYELVLKGNALPLPSKKGKLHKFASIRDSSTIDTGEINTKPAMVVLDKQMQNMSLFFFKEFLKAEYLLTDSHKSEKLIDGLDKFLRSIPELSHNQKRAVISSFGNKIVNGEEFLVDEAAIQIFSPFYEGENLERVVENFESTLLENGLGENNLRGELTPRIERVLGFVKIKTTEGITVNYPSEYEDTTVIVTDASDGDGKDILIKNVHIRD